ncbi:MAG: septal ring lytic transglycosylase RlpA family protein [Lewinellaceae bacterium]|nr:septal ring lytic transglycosylase RlpA family protein [Lewinellaceae bacterium]
MRNAFARSLFAILFLFSVTAVTAQDNEEWGLASYYSDDFQGRETAYGVQYDKNKLTAAHKRHPYGTKLKVTRLDNNKSVVVTVIDKGPYIKGRVVDLSMAAAQQLGIVRDGVAEVKVEVAGRSTTTPEAAKKREEVASAPPKKADVPTAYENSETARRIASREEEKKASASTGVPSIAERGAGSRYAPADKRRLVGKEYQKYGLYRIVLEQPGSRGYGVQVASLANYENVFRQVADLQAKWFDNILISIEPNFDQPIYKIILGPFDSEAAADNYQKSLASKHKIKGFVVNLSEIQY